LLAILAVLSFAPALAIFPAYAQSNSVYVTPAATAGDVGDFFDVFVNVEDAFGLVAYDVTLSYDTNALDAVSADFHTSPSFEGMGHFHIPAGDINDGAGTVRTAATLLGCNGVDYFAGSPEALLHVTFQVAAALDSPLDLSVELAGLDGCDVVSLTPTVSGGSFFVPPSVFFDPSIDAGTMAATTVAPGNRVRFLSAGEFDVNLLGYIQLDPLSARAGFGGVRWTLVDPNGGVLQGESNIAFMFPGETAQVSGAVGHSGVLGTHKVFVTVLRCASADVISCVEGDSASGKFFKVHA